MNDGFALAATINDLSRESEARGVADYVEFRMDKASEPLEQLADYEGELPIIATNRPEWFGGEAGGAGRIDRLVAAAECKAVELVDIEVEMVRGEPWIPQEFSDADVRLICSSHIFEETPEKSIIDEIVEECASYGDIAKVATFAKKPRDCLALLGAVDTATENGIPVAGIAMGELGRHTRVVGPLYGSRLGYAPLGDDKTEYAPGQLPLRELAVQIDLLAGRREITAVSDEEAL